MYYITAIHGRERACLSAGWERIMGQTHKCTVHIIMGKGTITSVNSNVYRIINMSEDRAKSNGQEVKARSNMPGTESILEAPRLAN